MTPKKHQLLFLLLSAFLALGLVLGGLMASNETLHQALHPDSHHPEHQCLATFLAHHPVLAVTVIFILLAPAHALTFLSPKIVRLYSAPLPGLPSSRGPPALP